MAAISYDSEEVLAEFSQPRGITFPLLSDDDSKVITECGILNTVAEEGQGPNAEDRGCRRHSQLCFRVRSRRVYFSSRTHCEARQIRVGRGFESQYGFWQGRWDRAVAAYLDCGLFESGFVITD